MTISVAKIAKEYPISPLFFPQNCQMLNPGLLHTNSKINRPIKGLKVVYLPVNVTNCTNVSISHVHPDNKVVSIKRFLYIRWYTYARTRVN